MREFATILMSTIFLVAFTTPKFAAPETLVGKLIDLACYAQNKANTENAHKNKGQICAQACAREGFEVGLLTDTGKIYRVSGGVTANNNARLVPYMAHSVMITGEIAEKDGTMTIAADKLDPLK